MKRQKDISLLLFQLKILIVFIQGTTSKELSNGKFASYDDVDYDNLCNDLVYFKCAHIMLISLLVQYIVTFISLVIVKSETL